MSFWDTMGQLGNWLGEQVDAYTGNAAVKAQKTINEQNINLAKELYAKQRNDALSDWERTNKYNSPQEMMNRFRMAGLNPNMIYGKGAETTAAMIRGSDPKMPDLKAPVNPRGGIFAAIGEGQQLFQGFAQQKLVKAQTDNVNAQTAKTQTDTWGGILENVNRQMKNVHDKQELEMFQEMKHVILQRMKDEALNVGLNADLKSQEYNFNARMNKVKIELGEKNSKILDEVLANKSYANAVMEYEKILREEYGISEQTNQYARMLFDFAKPFMGRKSIKTPGASKFKFPVKGSNGTWER